MLDDTSLSIQGAGGGGGGKKSGGKITPNNLQSKARARFIELLSEGEIEGLVDGAKSIYFNQTPLQSEDGTFNFDNVVWEERKGLPDDEHLKGHSAVETVNSVEVEISNAIGPATRTVVDPNVDAVRVILRVNSLFRTDSKGNVGNNSLHYQIQIRPGSAGAWTVAVDKTIANRKTSSPFQIAHRIDLPQGFAACDIRVVRISADETDEKNQSTFYWESYVNLIEGRFTYPHSALVAFEVNAEDLGTSIPTRAYKVKGLKINKPSNYNPITRAYTGIWNGTFNVAWTNNPAWIFYDLIVNDRYGLGEFVNANEVDKWALYQIAQYCDELIPSGYKDGLGAEILEPRYTYNGVITNREEAFFALQKITTTWRGMGYWAIGQYFATADMPADPVKLVTPANVIGGKFTYSSTAMKARHTVAIVKWNDPNDFYRPATELVIHEEGLRVNGWREKRVELAGCTSRGLAHRYGKWALDVENNETETVTYQASFDHADVRPGDIIAVADPRRAQARMGGRVVSHVGTILTLDSDFTLEIGETYQVILSSPNGDLQTLNVVSRASAAVFNVSSTATQVDPGSVFIVTSTSVNPRQFRVLANKETEENVFSITALFHDPTKYARVEQDVVLEPVSYATERVPTAPSALVAEKQSYIEDGALKTKLSLSWTPSAGAVIRNYTISYSSADVTVAPYAVTTVTNIDIDDLRPGVYEFTVTATGRLGATSPPATLTVTVEGAAEIGVGTVINLRNADAAAASQFKGTDPTILWDNSFPVSPTVTDTITASPIYKHNVVSVRDSVTNTLLRTEIVQGTSYTYTIQANQADSIVAGFTAARRALRFEVQVVDVADAISPATSLVLTNSTPATTTVTTNIEQNFAVISWPVSADLDVAGTRVWIETISGFDPLVSIPKYDGPGNSFAFVGTADTTYYIKIGVYDAFSKADMAIAGPFSFTMNSILDYMTALNVPVSVTSLPAGPHLIGKLVFLTTDEKLYRWNGTAWIANVAATDIDGTLTSSQIAAGAITAAKIASGAITAAKIDTADFAASGTAIFGGSLQSDNYNPGVEGWRVSDDGSAEFKDLVVRSWIAPGAVSDEISEVLLGPFTVAQTPSSTVVPGSTISLGAIGNGEIWRRAMHFDIRFPSTLTTYLLVVQLRGRELGGAFSAWEDVDTYSAPVAAANVWEVKRSSGGFSGNYDELQYRLVCRTQPAGGSITSTYQWLRNYYFAAARVTR